MKVKYDGHANKSGVYKITNRVSGKVYIGSAKRFRERASGHFSSLKNNKHQNKHLQASFNKHGADAFLFEVVEIIPGDKIARTTREQFFIDKQIENDWEMCFNFKKKTIEKDRTCFSKNPEETKKKLSAAAKKRWAMPGQKKKMSKFQKDLWNNPEKRKERMEKIDEGREKLSNSLKGNKNALGHEKSESAKKQISKKLKNNSNHLGHKHTDETKEKCKKAAIKQWNNENFKRKQSEKLKERWRDPKYKEKMKKIRSEQLKKMWKDPDYKEKMSKLRKKRWENPDYKEKMSKLHKKLWQNPDYKEKMKPRKTKRKAI